MEIERVLADTSAGPVIGGLSWRPPNGGKHSMRRLYEARNLTTDATHYVLLEADKAVVYGLYQPRASEERARLPKGVLSAAHCFAALVGHRSPNAALVLTVPASERRRDEKVYVVVLEDGVPVVDSLTSEMEARNALGSEDRPIWSDNPMSYPHCESVDFEWLASGVTKAARVTVIPMNPWPLIILTLFVVAAAAGWLLIQKAKQAEARRKQLEAAAANDPVPKYLAALALKAPTMAADREQFVAIVQGLFTLPVRVPGWSMVSVDCSVDARQCVSAWQRKGGTYDELRRARPGETLHTVTAEGSAVPLFDLAKTVRGIQVERHSAIDPARPLPVLDEAMTISGPLWQVWKTADISVEIKQPTLWPQAAGVPPAFVHPSALRSGSISISNVPGPFVVEALRAAPAWVSWETIHIDLGEGDAKARLKFKVSGKYYAASR